MHISRPPHGLINTPSLLALALLSADGSHPGSLCGCTAESRHCSAATSTPHALHDPPHAPHAPLSSHMLLTLLPRTLCSTSPPKHCTLELVPLHPSTFLAPLMGSILLSPTLLLTLLALLLTLLALLLALLSH